MGTSSKSAARVLALWLLAGAAAAAPKAKAPAALAPPDAQQLLNTVLNGPEIAYQGRMMVTQWLGQRARAHEVEVSFSPPNRYRWDFLAQDGSVERRAVSDGEQEYVYLFNQGKVLAGDAVKSTSKLMTPERENELLLKNYRVTMEGAEKSVGRPAWVLQLKPLVSGKLVEKLWVDQATGVVLEVRRFRVQEHQPSKHKQDVIFAAFTRFSRFEPQKELPESLFQLGVATAGVVNDPSLAPDFLSLEDLKQATGRSVDLPETLPGGFAFESADYFEIKKQTIRHLRYTDGLAVLSLFETDKPVRAPKDGPTAEFIPVNVVGSLRLSSSGWLTSFQRGRQYYTLMGDVSKDLLQSIASSLKQRAKMTAAKPK